MAINGKIGVCEIFNLEDKIYMIVKYNSPLKFAWVELQAGIPKDLELAREAQQEAIKRRELEIREDREFQDLVKEEMAKNQPKIKAVMGQAAAELAEEARKKVAKRLGRGLHGKPKDPRPEDLVEAEEE